MQVGQQILHVLPAQHLAVARHIGTAVANNVRDAVVIRGQSGVGKILMLENALQARTFLSLRGIGPVTAVAVVVIELASGGLLRVEAEFGVRVAALHVATREGGERRSRAKKSTSPGAVASRVPPLLPAGHFYHSHPCHSAYC